MIKSFHFGRDIHTADQKHVIYGMNNELGDNKDVALGYGFVANAINEGLLQNLKQIDDNVLGSVISSPNQRSNKDGISRDYHGIICHSHTDTDILRKYTPEILFNTLNNRFSKNEVASLIIGSGLMGQIGGANIMDILSALDESEANISIYTLEGAEALLAMQVGMKRLGKESSLIHEKEYNILKVA